MDVDVRSLLKEALSLLYWTMLAACTVGPGTVVTCARAGAEYQLHLIWALIFASVLAYTLQEGTARLTIVSGKSLGQCLQVKYKHGKKIWRVGIICWVVAFSVFVGNTLFECNNWAGGMSAIYSLPGARNTPALRISCCIGYGLIVLGLLFTDKVDSLGIGLGFVMVSMVILFLVVVVKLGVDGTRFAKGLIPISMPSSSTNVVLSLIGTTSLGFNLFLGGEMAKGKKIRSAQRGIAFSTMMALIVSVLILIVGDGVHDDSDGVFTIESLTSIIGKLTGEAGVWVFGIGFIAAALSSMLAVALGAALTAESVFRIEVDDTKETMDVSYKTYKQTNEDEAQYEPQDEVELMLKKVCVNSHDDTVRAFPKRYYNGLMSVMVLIAVVVISADAPTIKVILIAQVFNGCLLPFFSICLLICLNDQQFMKDSPQRGWANCFLITVVMVTLFLTINTIVTNMFGWLVVQGHASNSTFEITKFSVAGSMSILILSTLFIVTGLGKNIRNSFYV